LASRSFLSLEVALHALEADQPFEVGVHENVFAQIIFGAAF
jgi:hypothetical protein